jgi:hypothetical protein
VSRIHLDTEHDTAIIRLIARRDRLTNRRDGRLNRPALDEIDAQLSALCPAGQSNDVDLLLGRSCAVLPDYERLSKGLPDGITDEYSSATEGHW